MMGAVAFDTLKFANRLESVGISRPQAIAEAEVLSEIFDLNLRNLATKDDLASTAKDLQQEISGLRKDMDNKFVNLEQRMVASNEALRKDMNNELSNLKFEIVKWIIGLAFAQTGLIFGLMKLFPLMAS